MVFFLLPFLCAVEALYVTLLIQLALSPESLVSVSAVYSYLSLAGIMGLGGVIKRKIDSLVILPPVTVTTFSSSVSALVYTVPFTLYVFGRYTLVSILIGPVAVVIVYLFMVLSIFSLLIPIPAILLEKLHLLLVKVLSLGGCFGMHESIGAYLLLVLCLLCLVLVSTILSPRKESDVESQL